MTYIAGDFWRICDSCGFKVRASQTKKRWDNLVVCMDDWEPQHPQDFVRGRADRQAVPDPRPEPVDRLLGPLTTTATAAASAGATTLAVETSARFEPGDDISVTLASGDVHAAQINTVPDAETLTLTSATKLPGAINSGALIVNNDAIAEPDLG